jgi:hypothetical protein
MTDSDHPTAARDQDISAPDQTQWQEQKTALKWPMIVLFGLPMIVLAIGILLIAIATKMTKPDAKSVSTPVAALSSTVTGVDKDAQIAQLQQKISRLESGIGASPTAPPAVTGVQASLSQGDLANLSARVERLEMEQKQTARSVGVVYATHMLSIATHSSQPFVSELSTLEQVMGPDARLMPLKPLAQKGVPSVTELTLGFATAAAKANAAAPVKGEKPGLMATISTAFRAIISVRRIDQTDSQDVAAVLHRAELALSEGKLNTAMAQLAGLPPESQKAMTPWLESAKARILLDQTLQSLTEGAIGQLGRTQTATTQGAF